MSVVNKIRYNFWFSGLILSFAFPLYRISKYILSWIRKKVKVNGKTVSYYDHKIYFPPDVGININTKIYWSQTEQFEPLTSKTLLLFFKSFNLFFDIGSNFGIYSVLAQKVNSNIDVICFEPLPNIYQDNLIFHKANKANRQRTLNMGLSSSAGEVKLYVPDVYSVASEITSSSIERNFVYNQKFSQKEIVIQTSTLDHFLGTEEELMGKGIILKIDVEGHERHVLKGGLDFFTKLRPFAVIEIERKAENIESLYEILHKLQYSIYAIDSGGYYKLQLEGLSDFNGGRDFLLIPAEHGAQNYYSYDTLSKLLTGLK